ncbi:hypothetical protein CTEN210_18445 [Chaetoceros tenuissimus]|uniref:Leucine-rich repeat domain-containing protein n=1 Tax=Chaetoceros tenuissimus TaxID=426638 RepID=A0AAD3HG49_9STRA|nr:hypothetical protein CTEN210_18445 [Chaetoceros tenuissimus]
MRLSLYPPEQEWEEFTRQGPGVRMYKGKKTLFWNGQELYITKSSPLEVIIVLPGVEVIPKWTFCACINAKTVIMTDSVRRIEDWAFHRCISLEFITLSRNLEYIGQSAFVKCESLTSIFIPPSCREIDFGAFWGCKKLIIFDVPQHTQFLGGSVLLDTALIHASPFVHAQDRDFRQWDEVKAWIKDINRDSEDYSLHRLCCSDYPDFEQVYAFVKDNGLEVMKNLNNIGVSPYQYLAANPYVDFEAQTLINRYILEKMNLINTGN